MMLDELRPAGLTGAAKALGVDPFEVIRLGVASGNPSATLRFSPDAIAALEAFGGLERWWVGAALPEDQSHRRALARFALGRLVQGQVVGDHSTRLDNLWRDLSAADRQTIEQVAGTLVQEGILQTFPSPRGAQVSIQPAALGLVQQFVASGAGLQGLQGFW